MQKAKEELVRDRISQVSDADILILPSPEAATFSTVVSVFETDAEAMELLTEIFPYNRPMTVEGLGVFLYFID